MSKRVYIAELMEESDTFNPLLQKDSDFYTCRLKLENDPNRSPSSKGAVSGMVSALPEKRYELIAGISKTSKSAGSLSADVAESFLKTVTEDIRSAGPLDGVLVSLHGATVSEVSEDVCGDVLEAIRALVGEETVIAASLDLHAKITRRMMKNADFLSGYQTYPHLDHFGTGQRAASLMRRKLEGEDLHEVYVSVPMMAPPSGYTTDTPELKELMDMGHGLVNDGTIADFSVFQVQPWLDVSEIASVVCVAGTDIDAINKIASDLALKEYAIREVLQGEPLTPVEEIIREAKENLDGKPVVSADSADSPNAGAVGDVAKVVEALLPYRDTLNAAVSVRDPEAVRKAFSLGVGAEADFTIGAGIAPELSEPVFVRNAKVDSLHRGVFFREGPSRRGDRVDLGPSAVISAGRIRILLTTDAYTEGDLQYYRGFGIEPTLMQFVNVKACTSFRACYAPVASKIFVSDTPGAASAAIRTLPFKKLPAKMYPFTEISEEDITVPVCFR
ncbi:MAG: M81 family metallopeptidase [Lachnospiraceae bacterium]|nr:M81 family metallopeptidase [Lachnospiraceae bacterium]